MAVEEELLEQARNEAAAIVAEAEEQARRLIEAAEKKHTETDANIDGIRAAGQELAAGIERSIEMLTEALEELRKRLA